jgi:hypothetical protein
MEPATSRLVTQCITQLIYRTASIFAVFITDRHPYLSWTSWTQHGIFCHTSYLSKIILELSPQQSLLLLSCLFPEVRLKNTFLPSRAWDMACPSHLISSHHTHFLINSPANEKCHRAVIYFFQLYHLQEIWISIATNLWTVVEQH